MGIENVLPEKGVKVTLDKERFLCFPMSAMGYLAEVYGGVIEAFSAFQEIMPKSGDMTAWKLDKKTIDTLCHFVTAGMKTEDEDVTFRKVSTLLDMRNIGEVIKAVSEALRMYMPETPKDPGSVPRRGPKKA